MELRRFAVWVAYAAVLVIGVVWVRGFVPPPPARSSQPPPRVPLSRVEGSTQLATGVAEWTTVRYSGGEAVCVLRFRPRLGTQRAAGAKGGLACTVAGKCVFEVGGR